MPKVSTKERRSSPHKRAENDAEQGNNDLNELLILEIEKNPILYDKTRADYKRTDVWSSIGRHIGIEANEVKVKWKSNRDAFVRCRQKSKTKSGLKAKKVKSYKYAHLLECLIPTVGERQTSGNLSESNDEKEGNADESGSDDVSTIQPKTAPSSKATQGPSTSVTLQASTSKPPAKKRRYTKAEGTNEVEAAIVDYLKAKKEPAPAPKKEEPSSDSTSKFLNAMESIIRSLPLKAQAEVKFSIHKVVYDAEMEHNYSSHL